MRGKYALAIVMKKRQSIIQKPGTAISVCITFQLSVYNVITVDNHSRRENIPSLTDVKMYWPAYYQWLEGNELICYEVAWSLKQN